MFNRLGKPEDQQDYQDGYKAYFDNIEKEDNPYANWMRKSAEMKRIYWDMGWDKAATER